MPEKKVKKRAICFIRGVKVGGKWSIDSRLQEKQLKEYAADVYDEVTVVGYAYNQGMDTFESLKFLLNTTSKCSNTNADFIYVELGRYRRSRFLLDLSKLHDNSKAKNKPFNVIKIDASRNTIEAIERLNREAHFKYQKTKSKRASKPLGKAEDKAKDKAEGPFNDFMRTHNVNKKQLANLKHLHHGVVPIYRVIQDNSDLSPAFIADILHKEMYLTVGGKYWTRHNVKKAMDLIGTPLFEEFVEMMDNINPRI